MGGREPWSRSPIAATGARRRFFTTTTMRAGR